MKTTKTFPMPITVGNTPDSLLSSCYFTLDYTLQANTIRFMLTQRIGSL